MKKGNIVKLRQELLVMETLNIKPNYSELARIYECDRRTVKNAVRFAYSYRYARDSVELRKGVHHACGLLSTNAA